MKSPNRHGQLVKKVFGKRKSKSLVIGGIYVDYTLVLDDSFIAT